MLSIDEAIAFERQQAKDRRNEHYTFGIQKSKEAAEEHEQLAEWLEDYKRIKMLIPSGITPEDAKSMICTLDMLKRLAFNIQGVIDVIDDRNIEKMRKILSQLN